MKPSFRRSWILVVATISLLTGCSEPVKGPAHFEGPRPTGAVAEQVLEALLVPDSIERVAAVATLLSQLGEDSLSEVVEAYDYARPVLGDSEWMLLADWWTRFDHKGAHRWAISRRDYKTPGVLRYVIAGLARADPDAALAAMLTLRQKEHRDAAFNEVVKSWYQVDATGLLDHLVALRPGTDRQRSISTLVALKIRREGIEATRRWAESLDDELPHRFKLQTFRRVATELARVDPDAARDWAERHGADGMHTNLYERVAVITALDDPVVTLEWLAGLPASEERDQAVEEAYRRWVALDKAAAHTWIQERPQEPWLQRAVEIYVLTKTPEDPQKALELAHEIKDEARRNYTQARVVGSWLARDEVAAEAWLVASTLPDDIKRKVRERHAQNQERRLKREARARERELRMKERAAREP